MFVSSNHLERIPSFGFYALPGSLTLTAIARILVLNLEADSIISPADFITSGGAKPGGLLRAPDAKTGSRDKFTQAELSRRYASNPGRNLPHITCLVLRWKYFSSPGRGGIITMDHAEF